MSSLLKLTHKKLLWPEPEQIFQPAGAGPGVYARLAEDKVGRSLRRDCADGKGVRVGVLTANPNGNETEAPLAIICDFPKNISGNTLKKTYQIAWSFSRSRALITIEPHCLRVWSSCEEPDEDLQQLTPISTLSRTDLESETSATLSEQAAASLHWIDLVSGHYFQEHRQRFQRSRSADHSLLRNLKSIRRQLSELNLEKDIIHDLLARIIFIQFLFQRKDASGNPALNENVLKDLCRKKILSADYRNLSEILASHSDTYNFFRWLNEKFNGDLFPGKGETETERETEWHREEQRVTAHHLNLLSEFVSGKLRMDNGQRCLWPQYSFDAIPLDFISSIYEEFVRDSEPDEGVHYTPGHIVDFILDGVLPWESKEWDVKILDPACGSGIFLVKAFQRLIYRWKQAHPEKEIKASDLKSLLVRNIFGIDIKPHAVRVASFSLYLTMCDEIDPRHYWQQVRFPRLRDRRLLAEDFFSDTIKKACVKNKADLYDLVIGNAPWGRNFITEPAKVWAFENNWKTTYGNIGPLFLPKSAELARPGGRIAMMQPSGVLIFNQIGTAKEFREKLFSEFQVEEIVNLSALRFGLFKDAVSPSCIVTLRPIAPGNSPISYICPKPACANDDDYRVIIEPQDINAVDLSDAKNPLVWTALMWGGRRDFALMQRLSRLDNLEHYEKKGLVVKRQGVIRGDRKKRQDRILNRRILKSRDFSEGGLLFLKIEKLPINEDPETDSRASTNFDAFEAPQMLLKQGWRKKNRRFQAAIMVSDKEESKDGILCSASYVSVHVAEEFRTLLEASCLSYNSKLAVYYLLLSSGRFASYRPEPNVEELLRVPVPEPQPDLLNNIETVEDVDQRVLHAFSFKESEWTLIEDLFEYTLPDFKGDADSPGRKKTHRREERRNGHIIEPELKMYCDVFVKVLKAGFGRDKNIGATIFQEQNRFLAVRMAAIYLNRAGNSGISIESIDSPDLLDRLTRLNALFMKSGDPKQGGVFYQRVVRIYDSAVVKGRKTPVIYIVKPDKIRYWTRSMALRDADDVAADILLWRQSQRSATVAMQELIHD
ncbi:MAG: SAM-dependent DNA methyltransferase [Deltaproteobacteria bacterium]|nr:SAM-dependent DNA methyltransferase [Deltaproteobacteria bacterium]